MSIDKARKIEIEIKKIHKDVKKSSRILRARMKDLREDMLDWAIGDSNDENKGYLR